MIFQTYHKTQLLKVKKVKNPKNKHTKSYTKWSPNWTSEEVMSAFWPAIFCTNQAMLQIQRHDKNESFENFHKKGDYVKRGNSSALKTAKNLCFPKTTFWGFLVPTSNSSKMCRWVWINSATVTPWSANANSSTSIWRARFLLAFSAPSVKWISEISSWRSSSESIRRYKCSDWNHVNHIVACSDTGSSKHPNHKSTKIQSEAKKQWPCLNNNYSPCIYP